MNKEIPIYVHIIIFGGVALTIYLTSIGIHAGAILGSGLVFMLVFRIISELCSKKKE